MRRCIVLAPTIEDFKELVLYRISEIHSSFSVVEVNNGGALYRVLPENTTYIFCTKASDFRLLSGRNYEFTIMGSWGATVSEEEGRKTLIALRRLVRDTNRIDFLLS